jgi:hypothetical protein
MENLGPRLIDGEDAKLLYMHVDSTVYGRSIVRCVYSDITSHLTRYKIKPSLKYVFMSNKIHKILAVEFRAESKYKNNVIIRLPLGRTFIGKLGITPLTELLPLAGKSQCYLSIFVS